MSHRLKKLRRSYAILTPTFKITIHGRKVLLKYPFGTIGKSGFLKRLKKPSTWIR